MTDQMLASGTLDQSGPPKQFGIDIPGWWPRIEPRKDLGGQVPMELAPEQEAALQELLSSVTMHDGTRFVSIMTTYEEEARPFGAMYLNHSTDIGEVMSGMLGAEVNAGQISDLAAVGSLRDIDVSLVHFDTVGSVSCVTARRQTPGAAIDSLLRLYLIPQPQTFSAVLIMYMTHYQESGVEPFSQMCDQITATFNWRW